MVAVTFLHAFAWLALMCGLIVGFVGLGDFIYQNERRRRREWLRAHRRHMDSLEPQRWTK